MLRKKLFIGILAAIFMFSGAILVSADEITTDDVIEETPSSIGLWWVGIKENFSLAFTFNPEKRIEKAFLFAEKRMELAQAFADANIGNDDVKTEKIERMTEKAQMFLNRAEVNKEKMLKRADGKQRVHFEEIEEKIKERKADVEAFVQSKAELIKRVIAGEDGAKEELRDLNRGQREDLEKKREVKKEILKEKIENGDERAEIQLEKMEQVEATKQERKESFGEIKDGMTPPRRLEKMGTFIREKVGSFNKADDEDGEVDIAD